MTYTTRSEEFVGPPGTGPDPAVWGFDLGAGGWGCGQLQDYTDHSDNARLDGHGRLEVVAHREPAGASSGGRLTSARLTTKGRLHVRTSSSTWPSAAPGRVWVTGRRVCRRR
jgi:hypothetical protein